MNFMMEYTFFAKALIGLLAIINPLGAVPVFLSLCGDRDANECKQVARVASVAVAIILIVSIWVGNLILKFFGITVSAFMAGGGLLILVMAMSMLQARQSHAKQSPEEAEEAATRDDIAVVPLAIPLMAGPGAISLAIVDSHQAIHWPDRLLLSAGILVITLRIWISLRLAEPIGDRLGVSGLNIATRIMGLLLAAIGVQMIARGLVQLMPGLG